MRMGLVGFTDERQLRNLIATRNRNLQWERWPFMDADALWVNGAQVQPLRGPVVRVPAAEPGKPATILNLKEIDRPIAFTLPIGNGYFTPPLAFDPHRVDQVADVLNQFEAMLLDVAVDLTLASELAARRQELASPTYHLSVQGRLVGIVSATGDIGVAQALSPYELAHAEWAGRPAAGAEIPGHFRRTTMAQVMWNHAMRHSEEDLLPSRYRSGIFYWRRMPAVPQRWVREEHLMLISVLSTGPQTIASLMDATGLSEPVIAQALAALYYGGSITTDPRRAGPTRAVKPRNEEGWPSSMTSAFVPGRPAAPHRPRKGASSELPTVPQPLDPSEDK
jgi:hypothetical protein